MSKVISLISTNKSLTPFTFYSDFLSKVASFYSKTEDNPIEFRLVETNDFNFTPKAFYIDPITLPLLLSLAHQLKIHHQSPIKLHLSNTPITIEVLEFLHFSDFFNIVGTNSNPNFPLGKDIFDYDSAYLGGFKGDKIRSEHKLRCYSITDDNLVAKLKPFKSDEVEKRDYLVEHFTFKVKDHFYDLLFENANTHSLTNEYVEILAELITNGVLHSKSDAFVLMFSDRYKTKFSISDNGIGLYESLKKKEDTGKFYKKFELLNYLEKDFPLKVSDNIKVSILSLFETLYYSMLKERQGLFDLMCSVVMNCGGYFRLHTDNSQIIVSARMLNELQKLQNTRNQILRIYNARLFGMIDEGIFSAKMSEHAKNCKNEIISLANSIFKKYSEDTKFSAIRIFEVKFRGVHIEVEIPNNIEKS